jgi:elongation factor 2
MSEEEMIENVKKLMYKPDNIRNIGTIAHIDHGHSPTA